MKLLTLLATFFLSSAPVIAKDISDISELSGYKLGEKIYPNSDGIFQCSDNNITCWGTSRDLTPTSYNVQLNINGNREIYRIYATQAIKKPNSLEQCLSKASELVNIFTREYGVEFKRKEFESTTMIEFSWNDRGIDVFPIKISVSCYRFLTPAGMPEVSSSYVLGISIANTEIMNAL